MSKSIYSIVQALLNLLRVTGSKWELDCDGRVLIVNGINQIVDDFGYKIVTRTIIIISEDFVEVTLREEDYCNEVIEVANNYFEPIITMINMKYQDGGWYVNPLVNDNSVRAFGLRAMIVEATNSEITDPNDGWDNRQANSFTNYDSPEEEMKYMDLND